MQTGCNNNTRRIINALSPLSLWPKQAGAQAFISGVSARTMNAAVTKNDDALIRRFFPVWWPYGTDESWSNRALSETRPSSYLISSKIFPKIDMSCPLDYMCPRPI
jgi:hypothetical protein